MEELSYDQILWQKFSQGDQEALDALYLKYVQAMYNYGRKIAENQVSVEDAIQDIFVDVWQRRRTICMPDEPRLYLLQSVRYQIIHKKKQRKFYSFTSSAKEVSLNTNSPEQDMIAHQSTTNRKRVIQQIIQQLPLRQREIITLHFFEKLSCEEIGAIMKLQPQSVYNLLHRAITRLKKIVPIQHKTIEWLIVIIGFSTYL